MLLPPAQGPHFEQQSSQPVAFILTSLGKLLKIPAVQPSSQNQSDQNLLGWDPGSKISCAPR